MATYSTQTDVTGISYLGQSTFAVAPTVEGTPVGGLSGIVYDAAADHYYAISDDRSQFAPARFYTIDIALADGALSDGDVTFTDVTTLLRADGTPFPALSIDPEGIALTPNGLYISSEGDANALLSPFINLFGLDGQQIGALPIDGKFTPTGPGGASGIRNNLALESLTLSRDGATLFSATENALVQDGPAATLAAGSLSRILRYDVATGQETGEFLYRTDPIVEAPGGASPFATAGLVDLLALDDGVTFLAVERSFSTAGAGGAGTGNTIRIYEVKLAGATNVIGEASATAALANGAVPATKELVLDLDTLGIKLDNVEGISFGPQLADGRQSIVLVSDNNFGSGPNIFTQFLAFSIDTASVTTVTTGATSELLVATADKDLFVFDNRFATGTDRIGGFGQSDAILTTVALFDSNNDGTITFGNDRALDMIGQAREEVTIFGENGGRITSLQFDGIQVVDGVSYFAYSLAGPDTLLA